MLKPCNNKIQSLSLTVLALIPIKVTTTPEFALTVGVGVSEWYCEDDTCDEIVVEGDGVGEDSTGSTMTKRQKIHHIYCTCTLLLFAERTKITIAIMLT